YFKAIPADVTILDHFELIAEVVYLSFQNDNTVMALKNAYVVNSHLVFKFWPEILNKTFLGKSFDDPQFTLAFRYFRVVGNQYNPQLVANASNNKYAFAFGYRPVDNFVMHIQYEINKGNSAPFRADNNALMVNVAYSF
ncbi:MAG: hypothetical protein KKE11_02330, partial [Gammaproteobacteria bacterium]|nr:hypothetical protein [Gammaproteobacteria bacterium]